MSPPEPRRGRHVVHLLHGHIIFVTKYRGRVLDARAHERLHAFFRVVCADVESDLDECDGERDHVHLLVRYPPKVALATLVGSLKGVSSRRLRAERADIAKLGPALWSPSYFAGSVGGAPLDVLRQYIEQQDTPR